MSACQFSVGMDVTSMTNVATRRRTPLLLCRLLSLLLHRRPPLLRLDPLAL